MAYAETQDGKLHYEVFEQVAPWEARGETIIFHHGIGADPGIWTDWLPLLIDRYRVVRFDMRGYGRSTIPPADSNWTIDLLAQDLLAVADAAGAGRGAFCRRVNWRHCGATVCYSASPACCHGYR